MLLGDIADVTAPFKVKICGITSPEDALAVQVAGADALGLNFYPQSKRFVAISQANLIATAVRGKLQIVGLFVNSSVEDILQTNAATGLTAIQLHGDESPEFLFQLKEALRKEDRRSNQEKNMKIPVVRAFRLNAEGFLPVSRYLAECQEKNAMPAAILMDAFEQGSFGGTGKSIDWPLFAHQRQKISLPMILAGGLTPQNVRQAILATGAIAVDTASGVELSPGKKDPAAMQQFTAEATAAWAELGRSA